MACSKNPRGVVPGSVSPGAAGLYFPERRLNNPVRVSLPLITRRLPDPVNGTMFGYEENPGC